ncbi:DNA polymerase III subunit gamma/tau [Candidatus Daviesbacteria bacterium]|nr:DNA polymerase III subunit gamma/tau [Candidatus Daviesbacteria bacterium]
MVFYRKYRPQSLNELIGQEQVKLTLQKAFDSQKLSHAYLFTGPKGTGKTSTARILAKMVNCEGEKIVPCNKCSSCISITDGSNLDVIEIDAASNRGIDDIRDLREKIKLAPSSANKKVYIIDEVHMLSPEAFNALLKTLEEPPSHVLFILATTELHKIPPTILSRAQKIDFKQASTPELVEALKKVANGEKLKIEDKALELLAKKSDGSFRDGLKLLDQLASGGTDITSLQVEETLKSSNFESMVELLYAISNKRSSNALNICLEQIEKGINIREYTLGILDLIHALLLIKNDLKNKVLEEFGSEKLEKISKLSDGFEIRDLIKLADNFQKSLEKMKAVSITSLPLEIAVIESSQAEVVTPVTVNTAPHVILSESEESRLDPSGPVDTQDDKRKSSYVKVIDSEAEPQVFDSEVSQTRGAHTRRDYKQKPSISAMKASSGDLATLYDKWNYILETVKPYNYSLEAMLRLVKILECNQEEVIFEVPYSFHQRILEAPKSRTLLESVLTEVLGRSMKVSTVLGKREVQTEDIANIEVAADDEIIKIAAEIFNSESVN